MAIIGLTHDKDGRTVQRLSVSTKVAVGLPPDNNRKAPSKLDFFIFQRKTNKGPGLGAGWELDPVLTEHYGKSPREIEIILLDDDPEAIFPTKLAWWTATECKCWGDGEHATRRTEANPDGEDWEPCGKTCPDLNEGRCKPSGDLRFMLADFPTLGSICRLHTSSYRSIMQVNSAIEQIRTITGGRLAGIRASLVVRAEKTTYQGEDQKRHSTTIPALSLEVKAKGMKELVAGMVSTAHLFEQTKKLLGAGHVQIVEPDEEVAPELNKEFYSLVESEETSRKPKANKKEVERGTLQPSTSENRGHDNTGLETLKQSARADESKAAPKPVESKSIAEDRKQVLDQPKLQPKQEKETSKPSPESWAGLITMVHPRLKKLTANQIKENTAAQAAGQPEPHERQTFYELEDDNWKMLMVWDSHLFAAVMKAAKKKCEFVVSRTKDFVTVEDVISIGDVKYRRDPESKDAVPVLGIVSAEQPPEKPAAAPPVAQPAVTANSITTQTIEGKVREVRATDPNGKELRTNDGRKYVSLRLAFLTDDQQQDPHDLFLCAEEKLLEDLIHSVGKQIAFSYQKYKVGNKWRQVIMEIVKPQPAAPESEPVEAFAQENPEEL